MNTRLTNPTSLDYRENYDRIFRSCPNCAGPREATEWKLEHNSDTKLRHLVCRKCKTLEADREPYFRS